MADSKSKDPHRVQIDFGSARWDKMVRLGYRGSVTQITRQMWDERIAKEEGHEISGDETQLKSLQKQLGEGFADRVKLLKAIDPECQANTPIGERPVLVRFAKAFVAAGGHLASPSEIVNHKIKAAFFKKIHEAESKNGSENVLSQRRHLFIDFLLCENDVLQLERRISAPPEPSKPPLEVGGKNFAEFTEGPQSQPVFTPGQTVAALEPKVTTEKPVDPGAMETLRDIVFETPEGIDLSQSAKGQSAQFKSK